jgi:cell pole-organizing protein PopZ
MNEPSKQDQSQEPSMEEILASIRRIISDDGTEAQNEEAAAQPAEAPAPEPYTFGGAESEPEIEEPEEEPLELTQAVQDDGTVVDLAQQRAAAQAGRAEPAPDPEPEPAPEPEDPMAEFEAAAEPAFEAAAEPAFEPEPEPEAEMAMAPDPVFETEPPAEPDFGGEEDDGSLELYGEDDSDTPEMPAEDDMSDTEQDRLVSQATEAATLSALSDLARPAPQEEAPLSLPGGDRTLEQVVREAISEHLRTWLDANLPDLVERIVREEVRRLARRAEDS